MSFPTVWVQLSQFEKIMCIAIIVLSAVVAGLFAYVVAMRIKSKRREKRAAEGILRLGENEERTGEYPASQPGFFDGAVEDDGDFPTVLGEISQAEEAEQPAIPPVAPFVAPPADFGATGLEFENEFNAMRYNRSFRARLIQSDDEVKEWYGGIKNEILSYDRVTSRISWKYESFSYRRNAVAKLFIKGKTLCLYLALNPADYEGSKFTLEDESGISQFKDTPALYRIKSEKRARYAAELIKDVCARLQTTKTDREPVDYYEPYNGTLALIKKGLVKRVIEDAATSFTGADSFNPAQDENMAEAED